MQGHWALTDDLITVPSQNDAPWWLITTTTHVLHNSTIDEIQFQIRLHTGIHHHLVRNLYLCK